MKKLTITIALAGLAFCVSQVIAQTGGGAAGGGAAEAGTPAVGGAGAGGGSGVPAPSGTSGTAGATGGGTLGATSTGSIPPQSNSPVPGGAVPRSPTMGGSLQTQPGASLQTQPGASIQTQPGILPGGTGPSPNSLQNPLTTQGSGANIEARQGNQNLNGYGSGSLGTPTDQQVQRVNPNDPRLTRFNNEWWYWMPGNYWMYYRGNNWTRYDPYAFQPQTSDTTRYQTGYRGTAGPVYYLDENGLRYRRFYAPEMPRAEALEAVRTQGNVQAATQGSTQSTDTQATIGGAVRGQQGPNVGAEIGGAVRNE